MMAAGGPRAGCDEAQVPQSSARWVIQGRGALNLGSWGSGCSRQNKRPPSCPALIPRTCDGVTFRSQGTLQMTQLRFLNWESTLDNVDVRGPRAITRLLTLGGQEVRVRKGQS